MYAANNNNFAYYITFNGESGVEITPASVEICFSTNMENKTFKYDGFNHYYGDLLNYAVVFGGCDNGVESNVKEYDSYTVDEHFQLLSGITYSGIDDETGTGRHEYIRAIQYEIMAIDNLNSDAYNTWVTDGAAILAGRYRLRVKAVTLESTDPSSPDIGTMVENPRNYDITYKELNGYVTVLKRDLTITYKNGYAYSDVDETLITNGKVYDGEKVNIYHKDLFEFGGDGLAGSDSVVEYISTNLGEVRDDGEMVCGYSKIINAGTHQVSPCGIQIDNPYNTNPYVVSDSAYYNFGEEQSFSSYEITWVAGEFVIQKRPITITYKQNYHGGALDTDRVYDGRSHSSFGNIANYSISNRYIDSDATFDNFVSARCTYYLVATDYRIDCLAATMNYSIESNNPASEVYDPTPNGGAILAGTYSIIPESPVSVSYIEHISDVRTDNPVDNYDFSFVGDTYEILKKDLTITYNGGSKTYDGVGYDLAREVKNNVTITGLADNDSWVMADTVGVSGSNILGTCNNNGTSVMVYDVFSYDVTICNYGKIENSLNVSNDGSIPDAYNLDSTADMNSYNITYVAGTFTINKQDIWVCLRDDSTIYNGEWVNLTVGELNDRGFYVSLDSDCNSSDSTTLIEASIPNKSRTEVVTDVLYIIEEDKPIIDVGQYVVIIEGIHVERTVEESDAYKGRFITDIYEDNYNVNMNVVSFEILPRPITINYKDNHTMGAEEDSNSRTYNGDRRDFTDLRDYDYSGTYSGANSCGENASRYPNLVNTSDRCEYVAVIYYKLANITNSLSDVYASNAENGFYDYKNAVLAGTYEVLPYRLQVVSIDDNGQTLIESADANNYEFTFVKGTYTIEKKEITISYRESGNSKVYDANSLDLRTDGFFTGLEISSTNEEYVLHYSVNESSCNSPKLIDAGTYNIEICDLKIDSSDNFKYGTQYDAYTMDMAEENASYIVNFPESSGEYVINKVRVFIDWAGTIDGGMPQYKSQLEMPYYRRQLNGNYYFTFDGMYHGFQLADFTISANGGNNGAILRSGAGLNQAREDRISQIHYNVCVFDPDTRNCYLDEVFFDGVILHADQYIIYPIGVELTSTEATNGVANGNKDNYIIEFSSPDFDDYYYESVDEYIFDILEAELSIDVVGDLLDVYDEESADAYVYEDIVTSFSNINKQVIKRTDSEGNVTYHDINYNLDFYDGTDSTNQLWFTFVSSTRVKLRQYSVDNGAINTNEIYFDLDANKSFYHNEIMYTLTNYYVVGALNVHDEEINSIHSVSYRLNSSDSCGLVTGSLYADVGEFDLIMCDFVIYSYASGDHEDYITDDFNISLGSGKYTIAKRYVNISAVRLINKEYDGTLVNGDIPGTTEIYSRDTFGLPVVSSIQLDFDVTDAVFDQYDVGEYVGVTISS